MAYFTIEVEWWQKGKIVSDFLFRREDAEKALGLYTSEIVLAKKVVNYVAVDTIVLRLVKGKRQRSIEQEITIKPDKHEHQQTKALHGHSRGDSTGFSFHTSEGRSTP